jgi:hypothetical protein
MQIFKSLDIKKSRSGPWFWQFCYFSCYILISCIVTDFMVISYFFLDFYFYFLVEIGFLTYLRFCKPPKKIDFLSIIFREQNCKFRVHTCNPFRSLNSYVLCLWLLSLASACIIWCFPCSSPYMFTRWMFFAFGTSIFFSFGFFIYSLNNAFFRTLSS